MYNTYLLCTAYRYVNNKFSEERNQTFELDCFEKVLTLNGKKYLFKIWDTAGQEKYAVIAKSYYNKAHGIIVACSLDNRNSYSNMANWIKSINENTSQKFQMILIGNKCDLSESRKVKSWELEEKANEKSCKSFETSAKENVNISEAFNYLAEQIVSKGQKTNYGFFTLGINDKGKRSTCLGCGK